ncbi:MAG: imidazolonepropionase [Chitinophagales bacterium]|nr:imidazolonepropionase [Chitinophagales bacterium]
MSTLIVNIKTLFGNRETPESPLKGSECKELPRLDNAYVLISKGKIDSYGSMQNVPDRADEIIDATDRFVLPAWCDSHTHLVFAGSRESEFVDRIKGKSYEEIAAAGGGILNSAKKLEGISESKLLEDAEERLEAIQDGGTGAVEIKSGYGLTVESEIKILKVIRQLKEKSNIPIKATFLGAHAFPQEYKMNHDGYLKILIDEMIPKIADEGLADYIDVFCESNYFSVDEMNRILDAGCKAGLKPKVHVNQFTSIGGIEAAIDHNAISVDHLEVLSVQDIEVLKNSSTIATLLPSCSFFINIPYAQARKLIENNIPVALASDYNPGSTPSGNIPFVISLACIKMGMLPEEAINATTINGAFAMEVENEMGSIAVGKSGKLIISEKMDSLAYLPYAFAENRIWRVL